MKILFLLLISLGSPLHADKWAPAQDGLYSDPTGQYYVLIKQKGLEPDYIFVRVRPGSRRLEGNLKIEDAPQSPYERPRKPRKGPKIAVRSGDIVLAQGSLPQQPYIVLVSSRGAGFAVIENHGMLGSEFAVIFVSSAGKFTAGVELPGLFSRPEIDGFAETASSTWWLSHSWLDEVGRRVVVASTTGLVRTVAFDGGAVASAGVDTVLRAMRGGNPEDAKAAPHALVSKDVPLEDLRTLYSGPKSRISERLAAATALAVRGDRVGLDLVIRALSNDKAFSADDQIFVLAHVAKIFGEEAPRFLRIALENGPHHDEAANALAIMGRNGMAVLVEVIGSTASVSAKYPAIKILGDLRSKAAVPSLEKLVLGGNDEIAGVAVDALKMIREPESVEALKRLLSLGTKHDGDVAGALFFSREPSAIPILVGALKRWPAGSSQARDIHLALEPISGQRIPPDPAAWAQWQDKNVIEPSRR